MTTIVRLPVQAQVLEAALHSVCDQGRWQDTVRVVLDKGANEYMLELVEETA